MISEIVSRHGLAGAAGLRIATADEPAGIHLTHRDWRPEEEDQVVPIEDGVVFGSVPLML